MSFETWRNRQDQTEPPDEEAAWNAAQAEMRELGPCGKHPRMFWVIDSVHDVITGNASDGHCTICEEIRLERAATLRMALEISLRYRHGPINGVDLESAIVGMVSTSDASALDEAIRLAVEKALAVESKVYIGNDIPITPRGPRGKPRR